MSSFTATASTAATAEQVLAVLTRPDAIRDWSPIPFDVDGLDADALHAGATARVSGRLAGVSVGFDVQVHAAGEEGLRLSADGPVALDVAYGLRPMPEGSEVSAQVQVGRPQGWTARLVGKATEALLAAGALQEATARIAAAAEAHAPAAATA